MKHKIPLQKSRNKKEHQDDYGEAGVDQKSGGGGGRASQSQGTKGGEKREYRVGGRHCKRRRRAMDVLTTRIECEGRVAGASTRGVGKKKLSGRRATTKARGEQTAGENAPTKRRKSGKNGPVER